MDCVHKELNITLEHTEKPLELSNVTSHPHLSKMSR